jgi:hypothetical protein
MYEFRDETQRSRRGIMPVESSEDILNAMNLDCPAIVPEGFRELPAGAKRNLDNSSAVNLVNI